MKQNWQYKKLGEVSEISSARRVHQSDWKDSGIPFYRAREIVKLSNEGHVDNELFISEELFERLSKSGIPKEGDLMISAVGTLGATYIVKATDRFYYKDASVICISKIKNLKSEYLHYLFSSNFIIEQIHKQSQGATVGTITISNAKNFIIPIPPIEEQERIVKELDLLSGIIEKQKQQLKELNTLAQSIFYSMFGDPISNEKNWPLKKLGEICDLKSGKNIRASELIENPKDGYYPCYGGNGIRGYINKKSHIGNYPIIGRQGALCGNVKYAKGEFYATEHAVVCSPKIKSNPMCLFFILDKMNLNQYAKGVAQPGLAVSVLIPLNTIFPPLSLQNQFAEKIEKIENQKDAINKSIEETQKLFDYTMDKYFG